jgi:hypothetical protein
MTQTTEGTGPGSVERVKSKIINGDVRDSNLKMTNMRNKFAQTLIVDPNGNDIEGNGGVLNPFKTLQKAHDYALENIASNKRVIVQINAGEYVENLTVTRTRVGFVGLADGISKSTRISGQLTINTSNYVGGSADDFVSFENLIIASSSGSSVIILDGSLSHATLFKDIQVITSSSSSKCLDVINNSLGGNRIYITNCIFSNKESSETTIDFLNTAYANIQNLTIFNGTGKAMNITSTDAVVGNSRFESAVGAATMIGVNSSYDSEKPGLTLANAWIVNPSANGNGIEIASGAIANVGQVAFNVGVASGTGFAVKGSAGAVFINGNNLIVPTSNSKISNAITRISLITSLTPA